MSKKPRAYLKRCFPAEEKVKRLCLRCDRKFMAEGRFNRLCPMCRNLIDIYYSSGIGEERYPLRVGNRSGSETMHGRAG